MKKVYLDNNATTEIDPRVLEAVMEEFAMGPSNPSSIHSFGRAANNRLIKAREIIAGHLGTLPQELIFTGSGTEALNMVLHSSQRQIITSPIEHAAIHNTLKHPIYLPVGKEGRINPNDLIKAITPETSLIVLGAVNSETGVKNPIEAVAQIALEHQIPFVVDGVALLGKESFTIHPGISAMAFSGHKIHAPKGIGLLFVKKNFKLSPLLTGGGQERRRRAGTENLPGIMGLAKAFELLEFDSRVEKLRNHFESELQKMIPSLLINGSGPRVGNTSNLCFPYLDGETLLIQLDQAGIAASMGSACSSGALEPSRVLLQMGCSRKEALSSLRFSLSRMTTFEEITYALQTIKQIIFSTKRLQPYECAPLVPNTCP